MLKLFHKALIQHLFMGRMLVDNVELILEFHQPVGTEYLSDQFMHGNALLIQQLFCKKRLLFWLRLLCSRLFRLRLCFPGIPQRYFRLLLDEGFLCLWRRNFRDVSGNRLHLSRSL